MALSIWLATPRIALASGTAFLAAQLLDIAIFHRLRGPWWVAPLTSTAIASALDTALFFGIAFYCGPLPLLGGTIDGALGVVGIAPSCEGLPWPRWRSPIMA